MPANRAGAAIAFVTTIVLFVSCGASVRGYVLSRRGDTEVLIPPGLAIPEHGTLEVKLVNARKAPFASAECRVDADPISIQWQGKTALVSVSSNSELLGFGKDNVSEPIALDARGKVADQPVALDPVQYINRFRADLIALEANGCLHSGEGEALAASIAEKLPFEPFLAYLLRFGAFDLNEFIDLTPDFRLRVVYPLYSEGAAEKKEVKGVETVLYKIVSDQNDGRVRILPLASKDSSQDRIVPQGAAGRVSPFPSAPAYFRLFLKKSMSSKDPITVAIILSSVDRKHLDDATKELNCSSEASCQAVTSPNANCILFPTLAGVNAEIRVKVNGQEAFARLGAQVREVLPEAGADERSRSLQVKRLFAGRWVPIKGDADGEELSRLILMPGDVVTYH
jgi:hypothetical protein